MHLGDYNTDRGEVVVLCHEHAYLYLKYGTNAMFWVHNYIDDMVHKIGDYEHDPNFFGSDEPFVVVIALTQNAWENRTGNHPNDAFIEPVIDVGKYSNWMEIWSRALYSEEDGWNPDGIGTKLVVARGSAIKIFTDWWEEITKEWKKPIV